MSKIPTCLLMRSISLSQSVLPISVSISNTCRIYLSFVYLLLLCLMMLSLTLVLATMIIIIFSYLLSVAYTFGIIAPLPFSHLNASQWNGVRVELPSLNYKSHQKGACFSSSIQTPKDICITLYKALGLSNP